MSTAVLRSAAANSTRLAQNVTETLSQARHIELRNVPVSATPADIRRLLRRCNAQGVTDVALIYEGFLPTRRALLTLSRPNFLRDNLRALENSSLGGIAIHAKEKEFEDNANKSSLGSGPHGSTSGNGKNVILWNFPRTVGAGEITRMVSDYALASSPKESIFKLPIPSGFKPLSFLVKCESDSEAHRLVRNVHMTPFNEKRWPNLLIRARVVY